MPDQPLKRAVDLTIAAVVLIVSSPIVLAVLFVIWLQDFRSPIYRGERVGRGESPFRMYKLRSMIVDADRTGISSTANTDDRITSIGRIIRATKLDELPQLWNVLLGEMSLVGPRPNVASETDTYTAVEKHLLDVRPGITDFASIVFADEGDLLSGSTDPDLTYNQLIRPGKSQLGLFYVDHASVLADLKLMALTGLAIVSKKQARAGVANMLQQLNAPPELVELARRTKPLRPEPAPGATQIVTRHLPTTE